MPERFVRIGAGNVKHNIGAVRLLARRDCDSIGLGEAWRLARDRRLDLPGYRVLDAGDPPDPRSNETPMMLARGRRDLGELAMMLQRQSTPIKVAPERWARVALYGHPQAAAAGCRGIAHVNVHLHWIGPAADRPDPTDVDRVRAYHDGARRLRRLIRFLRLDGFAVVVTGDVNVPESTRSPGWLTAWEACRQAGLTMRTIGHLDAFAWDDVQLQLQRLDVIPRERFGSDHPGTVAELTGRRE